MTASSAKLARLAIGSLGVAAGYWLLLRPWHLRWGATDEEIARGMPWDDRVKQPTYVTNRAITIDAPPRLIWPWLAQMGELPRGGLYSYDWIERLMGMKVSSAMGLLPQHQRLKVGQALDHSRNILVKAALSPLHARTKTSRAALGPTRKASFMLASFSLRTRWLMLGSRKVVAKTSAEPRG